MTWILTLAAIVAVYLTIGTLIAVARGTEHGMPWQLFLFTAIFWPVVLWG